jgi:hypothetical protein
MRLGFGGNPKRWIQFVAMIFGAALGDKLDGRISDLFLKFPKKENRY